MKSNVVLLQRHAELCKCFSNATRLAILDTLRHGELSVLEIAQWLRTPIGSVSPHLLMMKRRGVLDSRRDGNRVLYRLAHPKMLRAFDLIQDILLDMLEGDGKLAKAGRAR